MERPLRKPALLLAIVAATALALSGCGRKGPLEPHPDAPEEQRARPQNPQTGESQPAARPALGGSRRTLSSPVTPPRQPFILDPLL